MSCGEENSEYEENGVCCCIDCPNVQFTYSDNEEYIEREIAEWELEIAYIYEEPWPYTDGYE